MLQFVEEALDEVALAIELGGYGSLDFPCPHGRDVRPSAGGGHKIDDEPGVVSAVGNEVSVGGELGDQFRDRRVIGGVSGAEDDPQRQTALVDNRVDLGTQSSTRTANGVIRAPFLPPAACW